jgi:hypothetical protein
MALPSWQYHRPTQAAVVRLTMQGIRRRHGAKPRQVAAATTPDRSSPGGVVRRRNGRWGPGRALILRGFAGALRGSKLVGLDVEDVQANTDAPRQHVRRSKNDQQGHGR